MNAAIENHFRGRSASMGALQLPTDAFGLDLGPASAGSGKLGLISTPNMQMARRVGVHPRANLRVEGSTTGMDVTKLAKYLTSGANKKGPIVTCQATYPEDCLTDACPLYDTPKLALTDLDLPQFVFGFLNMALCETLAEDLDPILANKIHFVQYMISNSFSLEWSHLIKTTHSWFKAWEQGHVEWDDWDAIEDWLNRAKIRGISSSLNKLTRGPAGRNNFGGGGGYGSGGSGNPGAGGAAPKNSGKGINGVPTEFFNKSNICMRYQRGQANGGTGNCDKEPNHAHPSMANVKLKHTCAGCWKLKKGPQSHGCDDCEHDPFGKYFQSG